MAKELFLTNTTKITFLDRLKECFNVCKSFDLSVSFIKEAGLNLIKNDIESALQRGVNGRIITSTYKDFTDPVVLSYFKKMMETYPNFECKLDFNCMQPNQGYHSKGYLFQMDDNMYEFLVGSTNITRFALLRNVEWNVSLKLKADSQLLFDICDEFKILWSKTLTITDEVIENYTKDVEYAIERWDMDANENHDKKIVENSMQRKAIQELLRYRAMGVKKALVVASTGSGKTYLAAFDAKKFDAKRLLFVVHRDTILLDAMATFKNVFKANRTYGLFTGNEKNIGADFIFATNITLSEHLDEFKKDEFDYIVMDECHHIIANTYQKIINYFEPGFMLGLTATPERMDNQDVFEMFDKNVPFELRLRDAIENNLVVPFHYYGIRDDFVDYSDKHAKQFILQSYTDEHCEFIKEQIEKYRPKHTKLKCLAFCRDVDHARMMAEKMADLGYGTQKLTGKNDTGERKNAYMRLQDDNSNLEIIFTVDILNEGIDIPSVNMVLFLRPTESQTIFIQQLGRGLRKYEGKEFLTVLDFIGNSYERSVQVAYALGGLSANAYIEKRLLHDLVKDNFRTLAIPGVEINFDQLSQEEVLKYIEKTNFNTQKILKQDYLNFKKYLNLFDKYPTHLDFLNADCAPDLMRMLKSSFGTKNRSYYNFLKKIGEENLPAFVDEEIKLIDTLSDMLPITRREEYLIAKSILNNDQDFDKLVNISPRITSKTIKSAKEHLLKKQIIVEENGKIRLNVRAISDELREYLDDLLAYGLNRYENEFGDFVGMFKPYRNYQKEQIMLEIDGKPTNFQPGTKYNEETKDTYIFVGLKKDTVKSKDLNYKDRFLSPLIFQWESVTNTTLTNKEGQKLLNTKRVFIFIRKLEKEDGIQMPFTYIGTGKFELPPQVDSTDGKPTLLFRIKLDEPVSEEYRYDFMVPDEELPEA